MSTSTRIAALAAAIFIGFGLQACRKDPALSATPKGPPNATYTVRGTIEMLPQAGNPAAELIVHHEPINDFANPNGTKGMNSMSMPFPPAKGVSLEGLAIGDPVELTFAYWSTPGSMGYEMTKITKLPPETTLRFGKAGAETPAPPR